MTVAELRTDVVILACAISAGIHGALVRDHFEEGKGAGLGFVAAAVLLAVLAAVLTRKPTQAPLFATAAVFAGLIVSYALAITTGLPVLHPEPEAVDGLALVTKTIEAVGLFAAATLLWRRPAVALPHRKGSDVSITGAARPVPFLLTALVAFFSAFAALAVSNDMAHAHGNTQHADHGAMTTNGR